MIKMIYGFAKQSGCIPSVSEIMYVVKRNFGGLEELDTWSIFKEELLPVLNREVCYHAIVLTNVL